MKTNVHIGFTGNCDAAFAFYETVFGTRRLMSLKYSEAPGGHPVPAGSKDLIMHTSLPVGSMLLMGADAPPGRGQPLSGFHVSLEDKDEAEIKRLWAALSEDGSVMMPLAKTFWAPLFGMCTDKFGVGWMLSVHESQV
jgi:PhnB protein